MSSQVVRNGVLVLDAYFYPYLGDSRHDIAPPASSDGKADIDLHDLLTMSSGLDCGLSPGEPELYETLASDHFVEYALGRPAVAPARHGENRPALFERMRMERHADRLERLGRAGLRIRGNFGAGAESVELEFTDPSGYFGPQTVQGSTVAGCN